MAMVACLTASPPKCIVVAATATGDRPRAAQQLLEAMGENLRAMLTVSLMMFGGVVRGQSNHR